MDLEEMTHIHPEYAEVEEPVLGIEPNHDSLSAVVLTLQPAQIHPCRHHIPGMSNHRANL